MWVVLLTTSSLVTHWEVRQSEDQVTSPVNHINSAKLDQSNSKHSQNKSIAKSGLSARRFDLESNAK